MREKFAGVQSSTVIQSGDGKEPLWEKKEEECKAVSIQKTGKLTKLADL